MAEPFIGEIKMFGGNFAPQGYAFCNGQLLSIAQNTALFSLLGTTYGGDGVSTFGLPDLRGRVPVSQGQGPGLSVYQLGQSGGEENHTLVIGELAAHAHTVTVSPGCSAEDPTTGAPTGAVPAALPTNAYTSPATAAMAPASGTANPAGSSLPHNNLQPYLAINFIIALQGIYPSRN
jgi:microcystin-dependent protein